MYACTFQKVGRYHVAAESRQKRKSNNREMVLEMPRRGYIQQLVSATETLHCIAFDESRPFRQFSIHSWRRNALH